MKSREGKPATCLMVTVLLGSVLLLGIGGSYFWLRSTVSWGSIGTISGGDWREDRLESELEIREQLHQWLIERGFSEATVPASLAASREKEWANSVGSPAVYTSVVDGDELYFMTWEIERNGGKHWRACVYYETVADDAQWVPGAKAGKDSASQTFDNAREFIRKLRDSSSEF